MFYYHYLPEKNSLIRARAFYEMRGYIAAYNMITDNVREQIVNGLGSFAFAVSDI